jgi:glutamate 5-kinase
VKPRARRVAQRWVVKLGTGILTNTRGQIDVPQIAQLAAQISALRQRGYEVLVVSSGAVGCGMSLLGLKKRPTEAFSRHQMRVAQVLVTYLDMDSRELYANIQRTVETLLKNRNVIPIFNENDVVSYEELVGARFGDNDRLSAHIAILARATRLIILSNIRGLATNSDGTGRLIREVNGVDAKIEKLAGGTRSQTSVGGMVSKLKAARLVNGAGIPMQIAHGREKDVLLEIAADNEVGTMFHA